MNYRQALKRQMAWQAQPTKPVDAVVEMGCQKKLHGFLKSLFKVVEMSSIEPYLKNQ